MPRRCSEASTPRLIVVGDSPGSSGDMPTFVAITSCSRLPRAAIQRPMMRSDSPGPPGPRRP